MVCCVLRDLYRIRHRQRVRETLLRWAQQECQASSAHLSTPLKSWQGDYLNLRDNTTYTHKSMPRAVWEIKKLTKHNRPWSSICFFTLCVPIVHVAHVTARTHDAVWACVCTFSLCVTLWRPGLHTPEPPDPALARPSTEPHSLNLSQVPETASGTSGSLLPSIVKHPKNCHNQLSCWVLISEASTTHLNRQLKSSSWVQPSS